MSNKPISAKGIKNASIHKRLLLWFLVISIIPLLSVSIANYYQSSSSIKQMVRQELQVAAKTRQTYILNWFNYRFSDVGQMAQSLVIKGFLQDLTQSYQQADKPLSEFIYSPTWLQVAQQHQHDVVLMGETYDYIYDIFLIDTQGNILFTIIGESDIGTNLVQGPYAQTRFAKTVMQSLKQREPVFSDMENYQPSNNILAGFISQAVVTADGELLGAVAVQLRPDNIFGELANSSLEEFRVDHYLVGGDHLLRSPYQARYEPLKQEIKTQLTEYIDASNPPSFAFKEDYVGPDNSQVLGVLNAIKLANVTWYHVAEVNQQNAFKALNYLWLNLLVSVIVALLVIGFAAHFMASKLTLPIRQLVDMSRKIAKGGEVDEFKVDSSGEISALAGSLNSMMETLDLKEKALLDSQNQALLNYHDSLERQNAIDQHCIVTVTDLAGTIEYVNDKFTEISGYGRDELLGANHRLLKSGVHNDAFFENMYQTIRLGVTWQAEICNRNKTGDLYWVDTTIVPFKDTDGKVVKYVAIRTDITQQKQSSLQIEEANRQLLSINRQFQSLVDNIPGISYRCRFDKSWTMLYISEQVERVTGYQANQLIDNNEFAFIELIHPDYRELVDRAVNVAICNHADWQIEYKVVCKDGSERWVFEKGQAQRSEDGSVEYLDGFIYDISIRKQSEAEIVRLSRIASQTDNAIIVTDKQGHTEWVNDAFIRITGHQLDDILGKVPGHVLQGELTDKKVVARIAKAIREVKGFHETLVNYDKEGNPYWIEIRCNPIFDESLKHIGFMAVEMDVTDRKSVV